MIFFNPMDVVWVQCTVYTEQPLYQRNTGDQLLLGWWTSNKALTLILACVVCGAGTSIFATTVL